MILESIVGFGVLGGAIWAGAVLLRRLAGFDTMTAVVISTVTVPAFLFGAFYAWACVFSSFCGF